MPNVNGIITKIYEIKLFFINCFWMDSRSDAVACAVFKSFKNIVLGYAIAVPARAEYATEKGGDNYLLISLPISAVNVIPGRFSMVVLGHACD